MIPDALIAKLRRERRITLSIRVLPKASKNEIAGVMEDGSVKLKVTAPPEKGKANAAVCELLSAAFGVPKRNVTIVSGETSRMKTVAIQDVAP